MVIEDKEQDQEPSMNSRRTQTPALGIYFVIKFKINLTRFYDSWGGERQLEYIRRERPCRAAAGDRSHGY